VSATGGGYAPGTPFARAMVPAVTAAGMVAATGAAAALALPRHERPQQHIAS
jgi:hypothetical protein